MKKYNFLALTLTIFLATTSPTLAQSTKVVTLKDGSVIKGKIVEMADGQYTIETPHLGEIMVKDSDILRISSSENSNSATPLGSGINNPQLLQQTQSLQNNILGDPAIMNSIQKLAADPEIQSMLQDPEVLNVIMSMDPQQIENNSKLQSLMQNPKLQEIINKLSEQMPRQ